MYEAGRNLAFSEDHRQGIGQPERIDTSWRDILRVSEKRILPIRRDKEAKRMRFGKGAIVHPDQEYKLSRVILILYGGEEEEGGLGTICRIEWGIVRYRKSAIFLRGFLSSLSEELGRDVLSQKKKRSESRRSENGEGFLVSRMTVMKSVGIALSF